MEPSAAGGGSIKLLDLETVSGARFLRLGVVNGARGIICAPRRRIFRARCPSARRCRCQTRLMKSNAPLSAARAAPCKERR